MFFSITHTPKLNYSHQYKLGSFCIGTDAGWRMLEIERCQVLYKGYADSADLPTLLPKVVFQTTPKFTGNFCALVFCNDTVTIQTDRYRSFPIHVENGAEVTNLVPQSQTMWTDSLVTVAKDLTVIENKFDVIGDIDHDPLTHDEGIQRINNLLTAKTAKFLSHNALPINAFLSGGVDSLLTFSYIKKITDNYNLIDYNHIDWDQFWMRNNGDVQKYWAYRQIHHWKSPCILTTGSPGDEFMLRSPVTANLYLLAQGTSIPTLNTDSNNLHYSYYQLEKHLDIFKKQTALQANSRTELIQKICNILVNDWQHWHLGNTLTWTPLRDLDITKIIMRMPEPSIRGQIMDSLISKELIERNIIGLTSTISAQKNTGNALANLCDFVIEQ